LINVSTSKFSLSPIKHSNLATLHTSTIFCKSNLVPLLVPLLLSHSHALWSSLDSKLQTDHSPTRHLFCGTLFLKNSVNLSFIHLNLTNFISLRLPFLLYPHLNFTLSSKLISSKNRFPLSLFRSPMSSFGSMTWLMYFISLSFHLYQPLSSHFICMLYGLRFYTVSGNKPPSISIWLVGFCRHFKSPHLFFYSLIVRYIQLFCYYRNSSNTLM